MQDLTARSVRVGAHRRCPPAQASPTCGARSSTRRPPDFFDARPVLADLVGPGELAVLVVPIDKEAPKGRLILPQVQAIRDLLDHDALALVVKERELRRALERLKAPPKLVVTDSQAFLKVAADTPRDVPLTSFSILFVAPPGRPRGAGARARWPSTTSRAGDRILVAEACTHHPIGEDIARVKIPRWLTQHTGAALDFEYTSRDTTSRKTCPPTGSWSTAATAWATGARCSRGS